MLEEALREKKKQKIKKMWNVVRTVSGNSSAVDEQRRENKTSWLKDDLLEGN